MSCFFIVDAYIDKHRGYGMYNNYIKNVKPIVERFGGEYLARTENVTSLNPSRNPQRVIIIKFPSREALESCFNSKQYKSIMHERLDDVDSRALIVEQE